MALARGLGIPDHPPDNGGADLLAHLTRAHDDLGDDGLSATSYASWRKCGHTECPSLATLRRRFGSFAHAASLAGIPVISGNRIYRDEDLKSAIRRAAAGLPGRNRLTMSAYEIWRRAQPELAPTVLAITNRYTSWPAALAAAGLLFGEGLVSR